MAIWQYTFLIVPSESASQLSSNLLSVTDDTFDDEKLWMITKITKKNFDPIDQFLQKSSQSKEYVDIYGNEDANCLKVYFHPKENLVQSVVFRLDYRVAYENILRSMIQFCILNELVLLDEKFKVLPLLFDSIKTLIEQSPQVKKYAELFNPKKFDQK